MAGLAVDADLSGGAIEVLRVPRRGRVELALRGDSAADFRQWFLFRVRAGDDEPRELAIVDAATATYPGAWGRTSAMASTDGRSWRRVPTELEGDALVILHAPRGPETRYAYFAPYPVARLLRLFGEARRCPWMGIEDVGRTALGRPLRIVRAGAPDAERGIWVIARQHPGEAPASFAAEGLVRRLANADDPATRALLRSAWVRIAPLVNLDGAELGNHRTSATGADLNRAWDDPDPDATPEVLALRDAIEETGADLFLDLHADETAPFAFAAGTEGNPGHDDELGDAEAALRGALAAASADFVDEDYYAPDAPGEADLAVAANQIGARLGVPALTVELPLTSDGAGRIPDGFSPARAQALGATLVEVLAAALARGRSGP